LPAARPADFWARAVKIVFPKGEDGHSVLTSGTLVVAAGTKCPAQRWMEAECRPLPLSAAADLYRELRAARLPDLKRRTAAGPRFSWLGVTWLSVHAAGSTCDIVVASSSVASADLLHAQLEVGELAERIAAAQ
jgi:hypothetical protein